MTSPPPTDQRARLAELAARALAGAAAGAVLWIPIRAGLPFLPTPVRFLAAWLLFTAGPGAAAFAGLTSRVNTLAKAVVIFAGGMAAAALLIDLLGRAGVPIAAFPYVATALAGVGVATGRRRGHAQPPTPARDVIACAALVALAVTLGSIVFAHRLVETPAGVTVYGDYDSFDLTFYSAWASEATHTIPPTASYYAGHGLNAAYYPQLVLAMTSRFASVPILDLYFRYAWPAFLAAGALMAFVFVRSIATTGVAFLAAALIVAGGDFSYLAAWGLPHATIDWDYVLWPTNFFSPTMEVLQFNTWAPSLPVFFAALYAIAEAARERRASWTVAGALLITVLFEFKPFASLVLLAALGVAAVWSYRTIGTAVRFLATAAVASAGILPYIYEVTKLNEDRRSRFLIGFFELPRRMLDKTDLSGPVGHAVAQIVPAALSRPVTLLVATAIFLAVGVGIRWAGVAGLWRALGPSDHEDAATWRLLAWVVVMGVAIPFALITDPYVDTLQFYQTGLYVLWIFTAVALVRLASRRGFAGCIVLAVLIALSLPSSVHYVIRKWRDDTRPPMASLSRGDLNIVDYLRGTDPDQTVILHDRAEGPSLIAIASARRVVLAWSRRYYAVGSEQRLSDLNAFFDSANGDPGAALAFLRQNRVTHVIVHPDRDRVHPDVLADLQPVMRTQDATLYVVPAAIRGS